jgi:putative DNA primase/helicase
METFTESRNDRHPTELAMLRGARLVIAQETEEGRAWAESRLKSLTGGDRIQARFMHQDFFEFTPLFKLLIAGNHKPRLRNVDTAMRRRLHLLPFTQRFTGTKRDRDLGDKLKAEANGIMRWVIDGARRYLELGLAPPVVVREATDEYFAAEDLFDQWLAQCCERDRSYTESASRLFKSWQGFAEAANERAGRSNQFAEKLEAAGFRKERLNIGRFYCGLRLLADRNGGWDEK